LKHRKRPIGSESTIIKDKISIELRPDIVDKRARLEDWEVEPLLVKKTKEDIDYC